MGAIRFLTLILALFVPHAAYACLADGVPVRGELQRVEKRDPSGDLLISYHIVLRDRECLKILAGDGANDREQIRRVQFVPYDTHPAYLDKLIGAQVAARGRLEPAHASWHTADAVLLDAELIGIFSAPDDDGNYRRRKEYYRDENHNGESGDGDFRAPQRPRLSFGDRPYYRRGYEYNSAIRNEEHAPYGGDSPDDALREEIIRFIAGTYLKFHHMPPNTVRRYYRPQVHFRGRPEVSKEMVISERLRNRRRWPDQIYAFDPDSVRISQSQYVQGAYDVRFEFDVTVPDRGRRRRIWNRAILTLDIVGDRVRICREDVESHWPGERGRLRGLARAEIAPRPLK